VIAGLQITYQGRFAPEEVYLMCVVAAGFFLVERWRRLRLWGSVALLGTGAAFLGAVHLLSVYADAWLATARRIPVAFPIIALCAWPAYSHPIRWPYALAGVLVTAALGWLMFDLAGAVYVLCMWTFPPAVRWGVQSVRRRSG
jgi:hypothetical protein